MSEIYHVGMKESISLEEYVIYVQLFHKKCLVSGGLSMLAIMLIIEFMICFSSKYLGKKLQIGFHFDAPHFVYYNLICAVLATCFYMCSIKGNLILNSHTVICSVIYAAFCFAEAIYTVVVYKHITIPLAAVMSTSGSLLGSAIFGYAILKEEFEVLRVIAMLIVILSVILPSREILSGKYQLHKKGFMFCIASLFMSVSSSVCANLYLAFADMKAKQYYALTNVFFVLISLVVLVYFISSKKVRISELAKLFRKGQLAIITAKSGVNFSSALTGIVLRTLLPISMLSIVNSALGMFATVIVSRICFKEKISRAQICSLILLLLATSLCAV